MGKLTSDDQSVDVFRLRMYINFCVDFCQTKSNLIKANS